MSVKIDISYLKKSLAAIFPKIFQKCYTTGQNTDNMSTIWRKSKLNLIILNIYRQKSFQNVLQEACLHLKLVASPKNTISGAFHGTLKHGLDNASYYTIFFGILKQNFKRSETHYNVFSQRLRRCGNNQLDRSQSKSSKTINDNF